MSGSDCVIWVASVHDLRHEHFNLLSTIETKRLERYVRSEDRARSALGAALLRLSLSDSLGESPREIAIDRDCIDCELPHGKPSVRGFGTNVSVTHSGDLVLVAISPVWPVGIDVEAYVPTGELCFLESALSTENLDANTALTMWVRKESVVKATGDGLRVSLEDLIIAPPNQPPRVLSYPGRKGLRAAIADLQLPEGYLGAVTLLGCNVMKYEQQSAKPLLDCYESS